MGILPKLSPPTSLCTTHGKDKRQTAHHSIRSAGLDWDKLEEIERQIEASGQRDLPIGLFILGMDYKCLFSGFGKTSLNDGNWPQLRETITLDAMFWILKLNGVRSWVITFYHSRCSQRQMSVRTILLNHQKKWPEIHILDTEIFFTTWCERENCKRSWLVRGFYWIQWIYGWTLLWHWNWLSTRQTDRHRTIPCSFSQTILLHGLCALIEFADGIHRQTLKDSN